MEKIHEVIPSLHLMLDVPETPNSAKLVELTSPLPENMLLMNSFVLCGCENVLLEELSPESRL